MSSTDHEGDPGRKANCDSKQSGDNEGSSNNLSKLCKWQRILRLMIPLPYMVGIVWHSMHPVVSVLTGQTPARKWYIDENALDPAHFNMDANYPKTPHNNENFQAESLCDALQEARYLSVPCHKCVTVSNVAASFDIARLTPRSNAVAPDSEAIVLVVPWSLNTTRVSSQNDQIETHILQFRCSFIHLIQRLSESPWLAKTVLIVSPFSGPVEYSLHDTVDSFLNVYLGSPRHLTQQPTRKKSFTVDNLPVLEIPANFQGAIIRNLLVLDFNLRKDNDDDGQANELRILPSGRRGALPNMDLTFASMFVYNQARFLQPRSNRPETTQTFLVMHPYRVKVKQLLNSLSTTRFQLLDSSHQHLRNWLMKLLDLLAFEYSVVNGPLPPHATALDYGIDALTIQNILVLSSMQAKGRREINDHITEVIQKMEYLIRSLSNLHERLHHSTSLYLLPSTDRFVKHEEYLVPNLLLLIPLIVRVVLNVLVDIQRPDLRAVGAALVFTATGTFVFGNIVAASMHFASFWPKITAYSLMVFFLYYIFFPKQTNSDEIQTNVDKKLSIQIVACLLGLLIHLTVAFGHVSLAFPSALLWTPCFAFFSFNQQRQQRCDDTRKTLASEGEKISSKVQAIIYPVIPAVTKVVALTLTCPFTLIVPFMCSSDSTFIYYGVIPLHLMFTLLVI